MSQLLSLKVSHAFGNQRVLHGVELNVEDGEFLAMVGPSGCGKSTVLNLIMGTVKPTEGQVLVRGASELKEVTGPGVERGMVYQAYSLYPHLTVLENVALGPMLNQTTIPFRTIHHLKWRRIRREHRRQAEALLVRFGLQDALHKYPHQLSGGMRQRAAVAQALIMRPRVLLLDEPFGALDEATREDLQRLLLELYEENRLAKVAGCGPPHTILLVTHEITEAIFVGDRVVGFSRQWNWRERGFTECPGATIVYDKPAPVFKPDQVKRAEEFVGQRDEIRAVVFGKNPVNPADYIVRR